MWRPAAFSWKVLRSLGQWPTGEPTTFWRTAWEMGPSACLPALGAELAFTIAFSWGKKLAASKRPYPATSTGPVTRRNPDTAYGSIAIVPSSDWEVALVYMDSACRADVGKSGSQPASPIS